MKSYTIKEFRVVSLRDTTLATEPLIDDPEKAASYFREHVTGHPYFDEGKECFVILLLNTRRRCIGHDFAATGTLDTILIHPRSVFRTAIVANAAAIVCCHNHPSGDPTPSEADIKVTRDLIRGGQILKIELLDHIIVGRPAPERPKDYFSLKALGYFY